MTNLINVTEAQPHQQVRHLLGHRGPDGCYLMADQGRIYAVYFPSSGRVRLDISTMKGPGYVRWLNTDKVEWSDDWTEAHRIGDGTIELTTPEMIRWVINSPESHGVVDSPERHWVAIVSNQPR